MINIASKKNTPAKKSICGDIYELYDSPTLGFTISIIEGKSGSHKQAELEKRYFVVDGTGKVFIDNEVADIGPGDLITIPKKAFHHIETTESDGRIEVAVVNHPRYDPSDVTMENEPTS